MWENILLLISKPCCWWGVFFSLNTPPHNSCELAIKERQRERERERGREGERGASLSSFSKTINVRNSEAGNYALS